MTLICNSNITLSLSSEQAQFCCAGGYRDVTRSAHATIHVRTGSLMIKKDMKVDSLIEAILHKSTPHDSHLD